MKTATPAAVASMVKAEAKEVERAAFWPLIPLQTRKMVMWVGALPKERASDPLTAFTAAERHMIAVALSVLESNIGMALRCMRDDAPPTLAHLH